MTTLFEIQTTMLHPIETVFVHTVDLQNAPRWHSIFTDVQQLTSSPIGVGSSWQMSFAIGGFVLEIVDYQPPNRVSFKGSPLMGVVPNFTIDLESIMEGTRLHYRLHPHIPALIRPLMALIVPPYGRWDMERYFRELKTVLAT